MKEEMMSNNAAPLPGSYTRPLRVTIVEDHTEFREYLSALISGTEGFKCLGSFRSVEDALPKLTSQVPDVMLIDIGLPGMNGIEGIRLFKERYPEILFLTLTIYDDDERIFDALCAGASGYLLKKTQPSRLVESVKEAAQGGAPMSPEIARRVIKLFREIRPPERAEYNLTPHEIRILKLLVEGHNYKRPRPSSASRPPRSIFTCKIFIRSCKCIRRPKLSRKLSATD